MLKTKNATIFILFISFLEGGAVMFTELISAKLVAPYFGTSLYVWASVLGITLGSLAIGYYSGGYLSNKVKSKMLLYWVLLLAACFVSLMPFSSVWIMKQTINMSIQSGVTVSMLVFLFPPLVLFGMMSPIIINTLTKQVQDSGKISGLVYSISTVGGILFTYLTGFYILPTHGITYPSVIFGVCLFIIPFFVLIANNKFISFAFLIVMFIPFSKLKKNKGNVSGFKVLYENEGIFGQVKVLDHNFSTLTRGMKYGRGLLVNNTCQTILDIQNPDYSLWDYAFFFPNAASIYPKGSDALILGLGGGTLLKQYNRLGFNTDVVELDQRVKDVSFKYFNVNPNSNIIIDDARHALRILKKKYDVITFDLFLSETPPSHLLTLECFKEVQDGLKPGGMLMINFFGFTSGDLGKASRSVYKTLVESGFHTKMCVTPSNNEMGRNLIFLASLTDLDFTNTTYSEPFMYPVTNLEEHFLNTAEMDFSNDIILTDDIPVMEHLYANAALKWRKASNIAYAEKFIANY
jgi:predicted membrane-bound spermidine synthase